MVCSVDAALHTNNSLLIDLFLGHDSSYRRSVKNETAVCVLKESE